VTGQEEKEPHTSGDNPSAASSARSGPGRVAGVQQLSSSAA